MENNIPEFRARAWSRRNLLRATGASDLWERVKRLTVRELRNARPVVMGFPRHGAGMTERKVAPKIVCKKADSGI